jgi:glycosyltransferase involved in cell wall biosynthesis
LPNAVNDLAGRLHLAPHHPASTSRAAIEWDSLRGDRGARLTLACCVSLLDSFSTHQGAWPKQWRLIQPSKFVYAGADRQQGNYSRNTDAMKVSVIIPCYRQAHYLQDCIASLQAQTHGDWEAIVVDDGSPDDVRSAFDAISDAEGRLHYVRQENGGLSSARNLGASLARGDFVQFLDSDDLLLPRKLEAQLAVAAGLPGTHVTYTDYFHSEPDNPFVERHGFRKGVEIKSQSPLAFFAGHWEHRLSIPIHSLLVPMALLKRIAPPFDVALPNHEDFDFWMRLLSIAEGVTLVPERLASYRISPNSMSQQGDLMWLGFARAINKQLALNAHRPDVVAALKRLRYENNVRHELGFGPTGRLLARSPLVRFLPWRVGQFLRGGSFPPPEPSSGA